MLWTPFDHARAFCEIPLRAEGVSALQRQHSCDTQPATKRFKDAPQLKVSTLLDNSNLPDAIREDGAGCLEPCGAAHQRSQATSGIESPATRQPHLASASRVYLSDVDLSSAVEHMVVHRVISVAPGPSRTRDNARMLTLERAAAPCVTARRSPSFGSLMVVEPLSMEQAHNELQQAVLHDVLGPRGKPVGTPPSPGGAPDVALPGPPLQGGGGSGCALAAAAMASAAPLGRPVLSTRHDQQHHFNKPATFTSEEPSLVPTLDCSLRHDGRHLTTGHTYKANVSLVARHGLGCGAADMPGLASPSDSMGTGHLASGCYSGGDIGDFDYRLEMSSPPRQPYPGDTSPLDTVRPTKGGEEEGCITDDHMGGPGCDTVVAAGVTGAAAALGPGAGGEGTCSDSPYELERVKSTAAAPPARRVQDLSYLYAVDDDDEDPMLSALNRLHDMFRNDPISSSDPDLSRDADSYEDGDELWDLCWAVACATASARQRGREWKENRMDAASAWPGKLP